MRKVKFALLFIGCLLMLDGHSIHARGDEPAKPKKIANAWVPEGTPLFAGEPLLTVRAPIKLDNTPARRPPCRSWPLFSWAVAVLRK